MQPPPGVILLTRAFTQSYVGIVLRHLPLTHASVEMSTGYAPEPRHDPPRRGKGQGRPARAPSHLDNHDSAEPTRAPEAPEGLRSGEGREAFPHGSPVNDETV